MSHIRKDLKELISTFQPSTDVGEIVKVKDVKPVASYSWIDAKKPTIEIPASTGSPPIWANTNPSRVPADSGLIYIDQNSSRMGTSNSPLTPLFAAVDVLGGYDYPSLDLVSDRNNLRKLLRWVTAVSGDNDFRIDVELAGNTCLFTRTEETDQDYVVGFKGFGHEYEKAATKPAKGCERATGHHRIISIDFGGLKVLLRFEVDACTGATNIDDLTAELSKLTTKPTSSTHNTTKDINRKLPISGITILETTPKQLVPQSSLIELKTRAMHRALDWSESYPQMYLSQTGYLYLAKHVKGMFVTVEKVELGGPVMEGYAREAQGGMGKLRELLTAILKAVREKGRGVPMSIICHRGKLELYSRKPNTGRSVGEEILGRFV